ncbi:MAG: hypothetical protein WA869_09425, partial [Alloacidobacterium sp.]
MIDDIEKKPASQDRARNAREYLLQEIASGLGSGTRGEALVEASYLSGQKTNDFAGELMQLLTHSAAVDSERWALIATSLVSVLGVPRPTIADFRNSKYGADLEGWK